MGDLHSGRYRNIHVRSVAPALGQLRHRLSGRPSLSLSPGLTFRLNGMDIPNDNMTRISVTNFTVSSNNSDGLECRSELTIAYTSVFTNGYLVADGTSPIQAGDGPVILNFGDLERGWDTRRVVSDNRRFHYLRRRQSSSEEGYYNCHIDGDLNSPAGLYILYLSESPYHDTVIHTHSLSSSQFSDSYY